MKRISETQSGRPEKMVKVEKTNMPEELRAILNPYPVEERKTKEEDFNNLDIEQVLKDNLPEDKFNLLNMPNQLAKFLGVTVTEKGRMNKPYLFISKLLCGVRKAKETPQCNFTLFQIMIRTLSKCLCAECKDLHKNAICNIALNVFNNPGIIEQNRGKSQLLTDLWLLLNPNFFVQSINECSQRCFKFYLVPTKDDAVTTILDIMNSSGSKVGQVFLHTAKTIYGEITLDGEKRVFNTSSDLARFLKNNQYKHE